MADYFETDEVTRGFDSRIVRRILGYLRPYRLAAALVLASLAVGTAGELALPVIVRRVVDRALMPGWYAVEPAAAATSAGRALLGGGKYRELAGELYLPSSRLASLTGAERRDLEGSGLLDPAPRYLFAVNPADAAQAAAMRERASELVVDGGWAAISVKALRSLPAASARSFRRADAAYLDASALILVAALLVTLVAAFVQTFSANLVGQRIMKDLRMELFRRVTTRSLAFLSRQSVGRLVTRMTSDVETINQFFTDVVAAFLKDAS
ncbi:MAG TPA: ABC transporter transmembrane domain-containing protein, partial [Rectinemataceae bacterium]|nr:ABC transporter transmembrane domain-containing protein [Rectinemataceae bacterium]